MKKSFLLVVLALMSYNTEVSAQGLLKGLKDKAVEKVKEKVTDKVERTVGEAADRVLDGKKKDTGKSETQAEAKAEKQEKEVAVDAQNVKSDFVRGSVVLFQDDLKDEQLGEFPSKWDPLEGNAEVASVNGKKCMELEVNNSWLQPLMSNMESYLPDVFTFECDFFVSKSEETKGFKFNFNPAKGSELTHAFEISISGSDAAEIYVYYSTPTGDMRTSKVNDKKMKLNAWNHLAVSFNKRALKVYLNDVRMINLPNVMAPVTMTMNQLSWGGFPEDSKQYITNFMLCKGAVELYGQKTTDLSAAEKAIEETGKFVTNNILFETGKATLKPESMADIKMVGEYMLKNKSARFEVQGHCDNQGSDKVNDPLSQKRAEAIVAELVKMGVDEFNLKANGKGSHEPVADNGTEEGRAKNRRVEFIKR